MNKEELNQEIGKLKASLEMHESQVKDLQHDLKTAEQRLADADKPKLTEKTLEMIQSAIEEAVNNYRYFEEDESYEYEMGIEYDNKVYLSHINFQNHDDLAEEIFNKVENQFGIADESDDDEESPSE
jgi:septal ring factor EnvC (AmiA/AmiB activator)